jgi:hypothetical protein
VAAEPNTERADPDDRLHEAIAAFEEARDAGHSPDPQEWLHRYPEVAARLTAFFAGRKGLEQLVMPLLPATTPAASALPSFGDYHLLTEIGRGAMGVVYQARQVSLDRAVALKVIRPDRLADVTPAECRQWIDRFRTEAQIVATLDHPHIVPVYEVSEQEGHHFFSMKLIAGSSLKDCLGRYAGDRRAAARLLAQVARAVHHAHQRGLLHRDLKPGNILVDAQGQPHVTDFGLAKRLQTEGGLTQSGALVGTPEYMAPEQAAGRKDLSTAADVYGLGAILYELLTGRVPFRAENLLELLRQVADAEPAPPRALQAGIDRDLETICLKCLRKEPSRRYGSAEALAQDLESWLAGAPIAARRMGPWERALKWARRRPAVAALTGLIVLVAGLGAGGVVWKWQEEVQAHRGMEKALAEAEQQLYLNTFMLAHATLENGGDVQRVQELLHQCPPRLRAWEWGFLQRLCPRVRTLDSESGAAPDGVVFSPDGQCAGTASAAGIKVWQVESGKLLFTLDGPQEKSCRWLRFSPDGVCLLAADTNAVTVWDWTTGKKLRAVDGFQGKLTGADLSADGKRLATAAGEPMANRDKPEERPGSGKVQVWEVQTGRELFALPGITNWVHSVRFSPDGHYLATVGLELKLWDAKTGTPLRSFGKGHGDPGRLAFSPDASRLACIGGLWDVRTGKAILSWKEPMGRMAFSPDSKRVAAIKAARGWFDPGQTSVWDARSGEQLHSFPGAGQDVAFSPDGAHLGLAGHRVGLKVLDAATGK